MRIGIREALFTGDEVDNWTPINPIVEFKIPFDGTAIYGNPQVIYKQVVSELKKCVNWKVDYLFDRGYTVGHVKESIISIKDYAGAASGMIQIETKRTPLVLFYGSDVTIDESNKTVTIRSNQMK